MRVTVSIEKEPIMKGQNRNTTLGTLSIQWLSIPMRPYPAPEFRGGNGK
jgi:hypothetical protein